VCVCVCSVVRYTQSHFCCGNEDHSIELIHPFTGFCRGLCTEGRHRTIMAGHHNHGGPSHFIETINFEWREMINR
jgi:hypothetical protein